MQFFGFFALIFWIIIITFPEFLAYLIGFFFVFLGTNILLAGILFRKNGAESKSWRVGGYEIIKNRK